MECVGEAPGQPALSIIVGTAEQELVARRRQLRTLLALSLRLGLALTALGGYWLSGKAIEPVVAALARERQFLANAAHALRTPVTLLQSETAEAAKRPGVSPAERDTLTGIDSLTRHLDRTVTYLLSLARRGAGADAFPLERLFLDDVESGTVARLGPLSPGGSRGVRSSGERLGALQLALRKQLCVKFS